jgi:hypothetical protein
MQGVQRGTPTFCADKGYRRYRVDSSADFADTERVSLAIQALEKSFG